MPRSFSYVNHFRIFAFMGTERKKKNRVPVVKCMIWICVVWATGATSHKTVHTVVIGMERRSFDDRLQAYFPKKPGNFIQHFLEICHGNRSRSGMGLLHIHMERAPRRFFFRKKVEVAKSHSFPIEITFFALRGDVPPTG